MLYKKEGKRYVAQPKLAHIEHFDPHWLLCSTVRYSLGRRTIGASHFAQFELAPAWPTLPQGTRSVIRRDIEQAFSDDDEARSNGDSYRPLGDDCDRAAWESVRRAWQAMEAK